MVSGVVSRFPNSFPAQKRQQHGEPVVVVCIRLNNKKLFAPAIQEIRVLTARYLHADTVSKRFSCSVSRCNPVSMPGGFLPRFTLSACPRARYPPGDCRPRWPSRPETPAMPDCPKCRHYGNAAMPAEKGLAEARRRVTASKRAYEDHRNHKPEGRDVVDKLVNTGSGRRLTSPSRKVVRVYLPPWRRSKKRSIRDTTDASNSRVSAGAAF